ncbi:MAG: tetratricopeptide repeat protein [Cyanobacteria bacterium J06659_2]
MAIATDNPNLRSYAKALAELERAGSKATDAQVLAVLLARDAVRQEHDGAAGRSQTDSGGRSQADLLQLIKLDQKLRSLAGSMTRITPLSDWRVSLNPPETDWWWFLEAPTHQLDRFDWLWNALTVTSLTASASLVIDMGSKFLTGGPGVFGSFAVISQSLITLATAGGVLTDAGRRSIDQMLCSMGLRRYYWQETKFGLSLILLMVLVGFRTSLPMISERLSQQGSQALAEGDLSDARNELQRAISLDDSNLAAHNALGQVFETFQQPAEAMDEYHIALKGGYLPAYNGLARIHIQNEDYAKAAALLNTALARPDEELIASRPEVNAELLTNLGWARLRQGRLAEAQDHLAQSLQIQQQSLAQDTPEQAALLGTTYCLLAKTVEQETTVETALPIWQSCLEYAQPTDPLSDGWIGEANERLGE